MKNAVLVLLSLILAETLFGASIEYWNTSRKGTNFFNHKEGEARLKAARAAGLEFVRLAFNKWDSSKTGSREGNFLFGNLDSFERLVETDVASLIKVLDQAHSVGLKVVLTTLSLPGGRWTQQNGNKFDPRLYQDLKFHAQAAQFWKQLAKRLKNHPAIAAYNVINEPAPERVSPKFADWYSGDYHAWQESIQGSPQDLNRLYETLITAIRSEDLSTPIILDSGFYATPWAFKVLKPVKDKAVLYSFHMYEPYAFTNYRNEGKYTYPGKIPVGENSTQELDWNATTLHDFLEPVREWTNKHGIDSRRVLVGEFGVARRNSGAATYLHDLLPVFQRSGWHWAFYSFREDTWTGMDYELGSRSLPPEYWEKLEKGVDTRSLYYLPNPLYEVIQKALAPAR